ncbi:MAG: FecR domain-containing protein [Planctomycetota bacterium]
MSRIDDPWEELGRLAAALCDGEITADEAERLEELARQSPEALRYFLEYVHIEGELHWNTAVGLRHGTWVPCQAVPCQAVPCQAPPVCQPVFALPTPPAAARDLRRPRDQWAAIAAAAIAIFVASWATVFFLGHLPGQRPAPEPIVVASLVRTVNPLWPGSLSAVSDSDDLAAGQVFRLKAGLAEIRFRSGAQIILEGPAQFELQTTNGGALDLGNLVAEVPPKAAGFTVHTPNATIIDRGTEIGINVESGGDSEVHVFTGDVEVRSAARPGQKDSKREVTEGNAIRVSRRRGAGPVIREVPMGSRHFVRGLPAANSVGRLRRLARANPYLLHHYTFEGDTRQDKCRDKHGSLHLTDVLMVGGTDGGDLYELAPGFDGNSNAIRPYRSRQAGNTVGVGLGSERPFEPPQRLTVELLLRLDRTAGPVAGNIATAVALRADPREVGFLGVAVDQDRLACRIREGAPESPSELKLVPGDWYYVATTFEAQHGKTTVNCYLANLSRGDRQLLPAVANAIIDGGPAPGRLGVGMGFDQDLADSYPWPGVLDEVAIYGDVLPPGTLKEHLEALVPGA